jgi:hypothetical protein
MDCCKWQENEEDDQRHEIAKKTEKSAFCELNSQLQENAFVSSGVRFCQAEKSFSSSNICLIA